MTPAGKRRIVRVLVDKDLDSLDLPDEALEHVVLTGADPVLPSSFAVGTAAQASMAAAASQRAPPSATYMVTPTSSEVCHCLRVGGDASRLRTSTKAV